MDDNNLNNVKVISIKPINKDAVHKICSDQVVLSLAVAVKELLENSLDAGATNIDVRLKNHGTDLIEVSDNGTGVTEDNFEALTLKYHTSKLNDYSDLLGVSSFGFRGEALSSLCSLANLTVITRHQSNEYATKIEYDHKGHILSKTLCSRQIGTTVTLTNLFCTLPVRQKEFHKNAKREFNKMTSLLYAYCLICKGVKITCSNQTSTNSKSVVVATQGSACYKDNIASVFGVKQLQNILEIKTEIVTNIKDNILRGLSGEVKEAEDSVNIEEVEIDLSEDSNDAENDENKNSSEVTLSQKSQGHKNVPNPVELTGYISSCAHGSGRSSTDRQFFYVNFRPCEPVKVIKLVNEVYRQFNPHQYPFILLNINIERMSVDINLTPDKRKVFLTKEKAILDVIKTSLLKLFEDIPRSLKVDSSIILSGTVKTEPDLSQPRIFQSFIKQFSNKFDTTKPIEDCISEKTELKRKSTSSLDNFIIAKKSYMPKTEEEEQESEEVIAEKNKQFNQNKDTDININSEIEQQDIDSEYKPKISYMPETGESFQESEEVIAENNKQLDDNKDSYININSEIHQNIDNKDKSGNNLEDKSSDSGDVCEESHTIYCNTKGIHPKTPKPKIHNVVTDKEELGKILRKSVTLKTSMDQIKELSDLYNKKNNKSKPDRIRFRSKIDPVFNKKCEEELSKEISKESFTKMKIVGQFNLGFIITRLDDDLFIIDQHATDEIYNFETLQKTTELTSQKLVIPQQLELTGVNEQILMDNLNIFKKNGFTFAIEENAAPTKRVKLLTLPMSRNWIFGKEDIEELLFMLKESQSECCRPSRVRAMFASRACRKSVMIGTALSRTDMRKLVDHMAEIDKPWNCPHGRPTIRHLVNLAMVQTTETSTI